MVGNRVGFELIDPNIESRVRSSELNKGPVTAKFGANEWDWLNNLIGDARKQDVKLGEATVIREAIYRLSQQGGWSELGSALMRRRNLEPRPGPRKRS